MRYLQTNTGHDTRVPRAPFVVVAVLLAMAAIGGAVVREDPYVFVDMFGGKRTFAELPEMSFSLGGGNGRAVDLRVRLQFEGSFNPRGADPYMDRIADRLGVRLSDMQDHELSGADGAMRMKNTITEVVEREMHPVRVRDVLLERMVVY